MGTREIQIRWGPNGPEVGQLTGPEARAALAQVMVKLQQEQQNRIHGTNMLIGIMHRDASRLLVGPDGNPVLPMGTIIPPESMIYSRKPWNLRWSQAPTGAVTIEVSEIQAPGEPSKLVL